MLDNHVLENGASIEWHECWFNTQNKTLSQYNIYCAWLNTAPAIKSGESEYKLPVVVIRYKGLDYQDDPILFMAGGPGSSILLDESSISDYWLKWFDKTDTKRDLVLFDQRGVGMSQPSLKCPALDESIVHLLTASAPPLENARYRYNALKKCHNYLKEKQFPINELGTVYSAQDARDLMDLLGYPTWNLQGVSYSTRLAMEVQRIAPDKIRSMVLDSVYPVNKHLFKEWPSLLARSLERIFEYCEGSDLCQEENGDIRQKFWELANKLQKTPQIFQVSGFEKKNIKHVSVNDETLMAILFDAQYHSGALYDLPFLINAFHQGELHLVKPYINDYIIYQFDETFSESVFWSVECNDNHTFSKEETSEIYEKYPVLRRYLVEDYDACDIWTNESRKRIATVINNSETPVLVLAGEDDPVTPSTWADETASVYEKSYLFSFSGIAHSVLESMPCSVELFKEFIINPNIRPSADCRILNGNNSAF